MAKTPLTQDAQAKQLAADREKIEGRYVNEDVELTFFVETRFHLKQAQATLCGVAAAYKRLHPLIAELTGDMIGPDEIRTLLDQLEDCLEKMRAAVEVREGIRLDKTEGPQTPQIAKSGLTVERAYIDQLDERVHDMRGLFRSASLLACEIKDGLTNADNHSDLAAFFTVFEIIQSQFAEIDEAGEQRTTLRTDR